MTIGTTHKIIPPAKKGLADNKSDVEGATGDLRSFQEERATYSIIPAGEGEPFFDLEAKAGVNIPPRARELAERIRKELREVLEERRQGSVQRDTKTTLERLKAAAEKGLTNDKPDLEEAQKVLSAIQGTFKTHLLRAETTDDALYRGEGFFTLARIEGVQVSPDAEALAEAISAELRRLHGRAGYAGNRRLEKLRSIAQKGLSDDNPDVEAAREELRREGLRYPLVRASGDDDFTIELEPGTTEEQRNFVTLFEHSFWLVRKLHKGRGVPVASELLRPVAFFVIRVLFWPLFWLLERQKKDPAIDTPNASLDNDFEEARSELIHAARFALPDRGSGRAADPTMAKALVNGIVADAVKEHGPKARRDYLLDLLVAYALTTAVFVWLMSVIYSFWSRFQDWPQPIPPSRMFVYATVTVAFLFVGAWLSAAQRINSSETAVVETLFAPTLDSLLRASVLLGFAVLVLLLLHKRVLVINLGSDTGLTTQNMFQTLSAAMFFGACSVSPNVRFRTWWQSRRRTLPKNLVARARLPACPKALPHRR